MIPLWLLFLPVVVAFLVAVVLLRRAARRRDHAYGGSCGRCGYSTRGLTTLTCPECGSDLGEVGIYVPGFEKRDWHARSLSGKVMAWTVMLLICAPVISMLIYRYCLPTISAGVEHYRLVGPRSGQYRQVYFYTYNHLDSPYRPSDAPMDSVDVTLTGNDGRTIRLQATVDQLGYDYLNADGRLVTAACGLTGAVVLDWMRGAGVDVKRADVSAEADEIVQVIIDASNGSMRTTRESSFAGHTGGNLTFYTGPPRIVEPVMVFFWLAVWLAGVRWVFRSHQAPRVSHEKSMPGVSCPQASVL